MNKSLRTVQNNNTTGMSVSSPVLLKAIPGSGVSSNKPGKVKPDQLIEENYHYLFENTPIAIFIWNIEDLHIIDVNDAAIKVSGYTKKELLQMTALDICPQEDRKRLMKLAKGITRSTKFKASGTWRHVNKNGDILYMDITSQKISYRGKEVILNMANNVTEKIMLEKKLAEERLQKQNDITAAAIIAQEKERAYLGVELHDNINQILATAYLYMDTALVNESSRIMFIKDSKEFIMSAIREIRRLSKSLVPPSLDTSLLQALDALVLNITLVNVLKIRTEWENIEEASIDKQLQLTIYRIVQEQLNNILKHADAENVLIQLKQNDTVLQLYIVDDGVGFDTAQKPNGVGLQNISSRAGLYNGTATIHSKPGEGCELSVIFKV